ncbi:MAG: DUF6341 family protein [Flavobacterium sp.]|jgi:hypothetical protein
MKAFFELIESLFVDLLFMPYDLLRDFEVSSWWGANIVSWIFIVICAYYLVYWHKQILVQKANNEDNQDTTAHSFLK